VRAVVAIAVTLVAAGCAVSSHGSGTGRPASAIALLADRDVVVLRLKGHALSSRPLRVFASATPAIPLVAGNYIAHSPDRKEIYVLSPASTDAGQQFAVIRERDLRVIRRFQLHGMIYRALTVGRRTGRLYLAGNTGTESSRDGETREAAWLAILSPETGKTLASSRLRPPNHDWQVFSIATTADEARVWVSYHGSDTTGADWIAIMRGKRARCEARALPGQGCIRQHGAVVADGNDVLGTTGEGPVLRIGPGGTLRATYPVNLAGDHVTELALSPDRARVAVLGPCDYLGGFELITPANRRTQVVAHPSKSVCGARATWLDNARILLARDLETALTDQPSSVVVIDPPSAEIVATADEPSDLVDLQAIA
jgi:hypothetical protein